MKKSNIIKSKILGEDKTLKINDRKLEDRELQAWNSLFGFLDSLTPEEWQQFDEAIKRRALF